MVQKALTCKATKHRQKTIFFSQLTLLSDDLALTSYSSYIYLESWFSWLLGGVQKTLQKKKKIDRRKKLKSKVKRKKNGEYQQRQRIIIYIFGFKLYFARKHSLKKSCLHLYTIKFCSCTAGYLKHSNDGPNFNIHECKNYK